MKYILVVFAAVALVSCTAAKKAQAQPPQPKYTVTQDGGDKIVTGYINRSIIENDSAFAWFRENMKWGQADAAAIEAFRKNKDRFTVLVFGGTWCSDTQNLWPVFYRLIDKSGYPEDRITLIGVDRAKTTVDDLHTKWNVVNVPTFIILQDGKEVGRVVEYGKYGQVDKELGEIVSALK